MCTVRWIVRDSFTKKFTWWLYMRTWRFLVTKWRRCKIYDTEGFRWILMQATDMCVWETISQNSLPVQFFSNQRLHVFMTFHLFKFLWQLRKQRAKVHRFEEKQLHKNLHSDVARRKGDRCCIRQKDCWYKYAKRHRGQCGKEKRKDGVRTGPDCVHLLKYLVFILSKTRKNKEINC